MPPTPYKRDRRYKSRMTAGADSERANLREKALKLAQSGLNRRGGPVDKGSPDAQAKAAAPMRGPTKQMRNERLKATLGRPEVNTNKGSSRFGQRYRTILGKGGETHDYGGGRRVFVRKPESGGTGNHPGTVRSNRTTENVLKPIERSAQPKGSTYDRMARDLAKRRAVENRPKARRKLFASTASYTPDTGRTPRRRRRHLIGIGVGSSGKRQYV